MIIGFYQQTCRQTNSLCANVTFEGIDKEWNVTYSFCFSYHSLEILSQGDNHDTDIRMCAAADVGR